jgi:hypothetical protein
MHNISARYMLFRPRCKRLRRAGPDFPPPGVLKYSVFASVKHAPPPGAPKYRARAGGKQYSTLLCIRQDQIVT